MRRHTQLPHIVFAGGATGGHLFPGLAVAECLRNEMPHWRITFVGSGKHFERQQVGAARFEHLPLSCRPLPDGLRQTPGFLVHNLAGYLAARRLLCRQQVDVVVGLGGYASVPVARAAKGCGASLLLLEQNVVPGRATRWLAKSADLICLAFEQTASYMRCRCPMHTTGTPVRSAFNRQSTARPVDLEHQLLVLGGSSGAQSLNENVPRALHKVQEQLAGWRVVHQSGRSALESTRSLYDRLGVEAKVVPFIGEVPQLLGETDLAVCRAGGSTLAELAAAGVPAILLPYPHAADDHQRRNAELYCNAGGCLVLDERDSPGRLGKTLAQTLAGLLSNHQRRRQMSTAIAGLARPDAAEHVVSIIRKMLRRRYNNLPAAA